jgi:hypothetical protein
VKAEPQERIGAAGSEGGKKGVGSWVWRRTRVFKGSGTGWRTQASAPSGTATRFVCVCSCDCTGRRITGFVMHMLVTEVPV